MTAKLKIDPIEDVLADYRQGKMVILVDDENRENEGDLCVASECITDDHINFMATHGRGLVCLTLTEERCQQLDLPLMVSSNKAQFSTNFTVSIEAADGVTTGISAQDRAITIRAAVKRNATPDDIVTPGHIFPIKARPGGVMTRAGHTEAGVDMARLAGYEPSSVICEILKPDGTMARLPDLVSFAAEHGLKIGTIADLIHYRMTNDPTVLRIGDSVFGTRHGDFKATVYRDSVEGDTHLALAYGDFNSSQLPVVRVHVHRGLYDVVSEPNSQPSWSIDAATKAIVEVGKGVLVLLAYHEREDELVTRLQRRAQMNQRKQAKRAGDEPEEQVLRMLGTGGQILADQGISDMVALGSEKRAFGLSGFGLTVRQYLPTSAALTQWIDEQ